ncbi:hypothetical protein [Pararhizobium sp. PWRC1-1]|uniref:hypothetical protein n=1 Tax=Pararhizobium sp. PWRC1-1 TaxID=2804566 RepID=UPI003CEB82EB
MDSIKREKSRIPPCESFSVVLRASTSLKNGASGANRATVMAGMISKPVTHTQNTIIFACAVVVILDGFPHQPIPALQQTGADIPSGLELNRDQWIDENGNATCTCS